MTDGPNPLGRNGFGEPEPVAPQQEWMDVRVKAKLRYWGLAMGTFAAVRLVTGSPLLAFLASVVTCWFLAEDDRRG